MSFAQRRVAQGKPARWSHPPAFRARCNDLHADGVDLAQENRSRTRETITAAVLLAGFALAAFGWYVLNSIVR